MFAEIAHQVTLQHVVTSIDELGDGTTTTTSTTVTGVLFAPEGLREQTGNDRAAVVGEASLFGQLPTVDANDTVVHDSSCCDGGNFLHGTWQVVGGSHGWGRGDKAIPIRRTRAV